MKPCRLFIAITFALTPIILEAQEISIGSDQDKPIEERIIYHHENAFDVTLHTRGLGAGFTLGKIRSTEKVTTWDFEISYLRSLKQIKIINASLFSASYFVYGKLNDVLALRAGYGAEKRIYGKPYWGGVELRWVYECGASLALLKPYYYTVSVVQPGANGTYDLVVENHSFDEDHSQWVEILGKSPFKYGLDEIKLRPGVHAKLGMCFEIGPSRANMQAIELGAVGEFYPQGLPMMAENPPERLLLTLYLAYRWGSRFNK